jgi:hypothetical protein
MEGKYLETLEGDGMEPKICPGAGRHCFVRTLVREHQPARNENPKCYNKTVKTSRMAAISTSCGNKTLHHDSTEKFTGRDRDKNIQLEFIHTADRSKDL